MMRLGAVGMGRLNYGIRSPSRIAQELNVLPLEWVSSLAPPTIMWIDWRSNVA